MLITKDELEIPTKRLAKSLLGCFLVHTVNGQLIGGRIVETEAYLSKNDPACHAHKGMTKRNETMFSRPGLSYVYLIYGMYHCFNVVSAKEGQGEAVLIRALEPVFGLEEMKHNRNTVKIANLCSGPGKLAQALAITKEQNGVCLRKSQLRLHRRESFKTKPSRIKVCSSTRIGINQGSELALRFLIEKNPFVSKPA